MNINQICAINSIISVGIHVLTLINSCFMHYFSSKSSKTSHSNHKNSAKKAKFSDKWSPGSASSPPPFASAQERNILRSKVSEARTLIEDMVVLN